MATVHIELSAVQARDMNFQPVPVPNSIEVAADTKTSGAGSALSDLTGQPGQFWTVSVSDGDVLGKFGAGTPVAAADTGRKFLAGTQRDFAVSVANERFAFIDA